MSAANIVLGKLILHVFTNNASLNAGHHVALVYPLYFIHSSHVHRDNGPFFVRVTE